MSDLRTLAEAAIAARGTDTWTSNALVEAEEAFCGAANPRAVIGLLNERDRLHDLVRHQRGPLHDAGLRMDLNAYRAFAVSIARMVASPGAEDTADDLEALDLGALEDVVRAEYGNGHGAGDRARFSRCIEDLARALGLDVRRAPEWGEMVGRVREVVRRDEAAASRWQWTVATTPGGGAILSYRAPGHPGFALIASALPRKDGMLAVSVLGQKRTAAADLPAALATIRAVLGGDVPEIPNERSES